ncbi:MAG TPA: hypothetical protein VEC99_03175, partial [Clostridia bacterium]|nr:hypothetical protein [Clostridia bacterium]
PLEIVFQVVFEFGCYYLGRLVVPVISLGRWKCDQVTTNVPRRKLRGSGFYHMRGQQVYLTAEATQIMGLLSLVLIVGGGFLVRYLSRA